MSIDAHRFVAAIVLRVQQERGATALLLRRRVVRPGYDLPGGELLDGELPVPGLMRWLALSTPADSAFTRAVSWEWLQTCAVTLHGEGPMGTGFVLLAKIDDAVAASVMTIDTKLPGALRWFALDDARHWLPHVPDAVMRLLVQALMTVRAHRTGVLPIHQDALWEAPDGGGGDVRQESLNMEESNGEERSYTTA
jgi:hypothetical protein